MKNILVPIGVSSHAHANLHYALSLAKFFESTVYAVDAYPTHSSKASIINIQARLEDENYQRIVEMVTAMGPEAKAVKIVRSEQDLIGTVKRLHKSIGLDLILVAPLNNDIDDAIFLGHIAGSLIKRTVVPVWVAPLEKAFEIPKNILMAFKDGEVKEEVTLKPLIRIQERFQSLLNLLLVKVPGFSKNNHKLNDAITSRAEGLKFSQNGTVYQGVLEHFQALLPDMIVVFKRERGFFEKLWETDLVFKKDFYCTVPILVLKNP